MFSNPPDYSVHRAGWGKSNLAYDSSRSEKEEFLTAADASWQLRGPGLCFRDWKVPHLQPLCSCSTIEAIGYELRALGLNAESATSTIVNTVSFIARLRNKIRLS
jgi:hypothetical protein